MKHLKASLTGVIVLTAVITSVMLMQSASAAEIRPGDAEAAEIAALRADVAALTARVDAGESTVHTPFRVLDNKDKTVLEITAGPLGNIMILQGDYGAVVASVSATTVDLHIDDKKATYMFRAWVTSTGLGAVAVGPAGNGVAGSLTGGKPASALLGKKQ